MVPPRRFLPAYALLAAALAASGLATWHLSTGHRRGPLAPEAVVLVDRFLSAVQRGDLKTACRLFSAYPSCDPTVVPPPLQSYEVQPAEAAVGGVDVPATLNGEYALFSVSKRLGHYWIVDIVADPAAFSPLAIPTPYIA
jgi:hypothetical protein